MVRPTKTKIPLSLRVLQKLHKKEEVTVPRVIFASLGECSLDLNAGKKANQMDAYGSRCSIDLSSHCAAWPNSPKNRWKNASPRGAPYAWHVPQRLKHFFRPDGVSAPPQSRR